MFKKQNRLNKGEFEELFKSGKKTHLPHLTIIHQTSNTQKVAVVVGKKVAKSAVRRNTLKRRVFALLRNQTNEKVDLGGMIIILKPGFNSLPRKQAAEAVQEGVAQVLKSA